MKKAIAPRSSSRNWRIERVIFPKANAKVAWDILKTFRQITIKPAKRQEPVPAFRHKWRQKYEKVFKMAGNPNDLETILTSRVALAKVRRHFLRVRPTLNSAAA
jgi:hypothetical protein